MIWGLYNERYGPNIPFERDFNYTIEMYSKLGNLLVEDKIFLILHNMW